MANQIIIPKTKTPGSVIVILLAIMIGATVILSSWIGLYGILLLCLILAFSTSTYLQGGIPAFHALIIVNSISGKMRTVFPGLNPKLPWEHAQKTSDGKLSYIDLRVDLKEVCEETYASKDALMETKYVYTIRPDLSDRFGTDAGQKILIYSSFEPSAIKSKGRALFSMLLSDHYADKSGSDLLKKNDINIAVFGPEDNLKSEIRTFEKKHAVEATIRLEDSDFDKATQKFRDMISGAKSFDEAIEKLMTKLTKEEALKVAKLMNLDGYTEKDFNLNVQAPDLKNLRDVTFLGGLDDKGKGAKK